MKRRLAKKREAGRGPRLSGLAAALLAVAFGLPAMAAGARHIEWSDLANPAGVFGLMMKADSENAGQSGGAVLQGEMVEIAGYLLPADQEGDLVYSFLLVPVYGGCIHTPSPPADQIVLVVPTEPFRAREIYQSVSVTGRLAFEREKTQLFVLDGVKVIESGYSIAGAVVGPADLPSGGQSGSANPWRRLAPANR
ncbi:MAG: DUF3299 domain-containing protein [Rhizobiaceae bacterium]